jgi:hypothetical protein
LANNAPDPTSFVAVDVLINEREVLIEKMSNGWSINLLPLHVAIVDSSLQNVTDT